MAWTCLAVALAGLALSVVLGARSSLTSPAPLVKSPEVLQERARDIVQKLGHSSPAVDTSWGFETASDYMTYVRDHETSSRRWDRLTTGRPAAVRFWFRQSPRPMVARPGLTTVKRWDPPMVLSGMALVVLDTQGRLLNLEVVPPQKDESEVPASSPDWTVLFAEAGLDMGQFTPAKPVWSPPMYSDTRMAWDGSWPGTPDIRIHLEASGYKGRPG